jgi:hypothetical protein
VRFASFCAPRAGGTTFVLAPVLWSDERLVPDRDRRISLGDLVDLIFL